MRKRGQAFAGLILTVLIIVGVSFLSLLASPSLSIQAAPPLPTLPPRATPTPTATPDTTKRRDEKPVGASVMLQVQSPQSGLWTIVQWQDNTGTWHDVEGWQGALDGGNTKVWWVAEADFGKGPFRWVVYQNKGGKLLSESASFSLPDKANKTVQVEVTLKP